MNKLRLHLNDSNKDKMTIYTIRCTFVSGVPIL